MNRQVPAVYTFWEPRGSMPAYLRLCLETWRRHLNAPIVILDHANLEEHIGASVLDLEVLRRLPLPMQKDAIMGATLRRNGGVFLDTDTIVLGDLEELTAPLTRSELVLFSVYLGGGAARPGGRIVTHWVEAVRERLALLKSVADIPPLPWGHLGNDVVEEFLQLLIDESTAVRTLARLPALHRLAGFRRGEGDASLPLLPRTRRVLLRRTRTAILRFTLRRHFRMLSPHAIVPEERALRKSGLSFGDRYTGFWFDGLGTLNDVLRGRPPLIFLHHSHTPPAYSELSEEEVLHHPGLLAQVLRVALGQAAGDR